jgi:hypothetical protein
MHTILPEMDVPVLKKMANKKKKTQKLTTDELMAIMTAIYEKIHEYEYLEEECPLVTPNQYVTYKNVRKKLEDIAHDKETDTWKLTANH